MTDYKDVGKAALGVLSLTRGWKSPEDEKTVEGSLDAPLIVENNAAIKIGQSLATDLSDVVLRVRALELEEADNDDHISSLDEKMFSLHIAMSPLEAQIGKLSGRAGRLEELKAEQQSLHDDKADIHECQREVLMELYDTMHPVLVSHGLIPELDEPVDADWHEAEDDTQTPAVEPAEHSTDACGPKAASPSSEETATSVKSTSVKLQTDAASNPTTSPSSQSQEPMKRDYQIAKAMFRGAEEDFEFRFEKLQHNRYIIEQQKAAAGEVISDKSLLQLDMQDITETRRLAKALAEAEENLAKAKEACLLAGVDTADSEMESGFLDGVDDGYSVSEEKEMIASVTPAGMERWLKQISDNLKIEQDGEEQSREHGADADVRSVEIEDSASMVAQGASRRRIDKWREMYQTLAVTE